MKRLLAYLFIVLGLGLVFNVNASEINIKNTKWSIKTAHSGYEIHFLPNGSCIILLPLKQKKNFKKFSKSMRCNWYSGGNSLNYTIKTFTKEKLTFESNMRALISDTSNSLQGKYYYHGTGGAAGISFYGNLIEGKLKTQIAKAEPSQTQEVAKIEQRLNQILNLWKQGALTHKQWEKARKKLLKERSQIQQTQIAKVEPSQTQGVDKLNYDDFINKYLGNSEGPGPSHQILFLKGNDCFYDPVFDVSTKGVHQLNCRWEKEDNKLFIEINDEINDWYEKFIFEKYRKDFYITYKNKKYPTYFKDGKEIRKNISKLIESLNRKKQTQIAKAEPSQTQEVDQLHGHLIKPDTWVYFVSTKDRGSYSIKDFGIWNASKFNASHFLDNKKNMKNYRFDTNEKLFKYQRIIGGSYVEFIRISEKLNNLIFSKSIKNSNHAKSIASRIENYKPKILKELIDEYTEDNELKEGLLAYFDQGLFNPDNIAALLDESKTEPTIKPKKKVKVAKVEEPKQEEFKPEDKDIDNEAPVIQIAEAITVNDSDYEFEGKVTDKSKQIFIEVDGRLVDVKKGKFTVKGYSPVDKEISIQAIDGYGNRSKPKIVKLIIDIKDTDIAEKLEPLNPSKIRAKVSKSRVALIIGIENYTEAPKANYANLDAKYFFDYARKGFGIKKQNINLLVDENATFVKTSKALTLWLKTKIKADQTDLVVFFAGHGLASSDGKELYLLPQDSDPNLLDITALSRTKLFQTIIDLKPKSVTMFLDTCYSGVSRDEQMLLASARPIRIVADEQEGIPDNFTIFTASQVEQISSGLKEANHGIFSYYLMKGLEGKADSNNDKKITNGELLAYMDENVSQKASELGRQQNPSLAGDPDKVLMSYR